MRCRLETVALINFAFTWQKQGNPLCGEKTYVRLPNGQQWQDESLAPRQVLHSDKLSFYSSADREEVDLSYGVTGRLEEVVQKLRERT